MRSLMTDSYRFWVILRVGIVYLSIVQMLIVGLIG